MEFKAEIDFKTKEIVLTHKERGKVIFNTLNSTYKIIEKESKYNNLRKFFVNYALGNYSRNSSFLNNCEYNSLKEKKAISLYFEFIYRFTKNSSYYTKSNLGNIWIDFKETIRKSEKKIVNKDVWNTEKKEYIKKTIERKEILFPNLSELRDVRYGGHYNYITFKKQVERLFNLISCDLNLELYSYNCLDYKIPKFRKDIRKILIKERVIINVELLEFNCKNKELFNNLILTLNNEKLFDYYNYYEERSLNRIMNNYERINQLINMNYDLKSIIINFHNYFGIYEGLRFNEYLIYLKDYANMNKLMEIKEFKKYPKYLKSNHDIVNNEFENYKKTYNEEIFNKNINHKLEYKCKKFMIISPKETEDLKKEGKELSHCVGSYISRVIEGKTQIFFLREKEKESLVTIELRDSSIIQAKGYGNRSISKEERKYLEEYAKVFNLLIRV